MRRNQISKRDIAFWRAYFEVLNERIALIDEWSDGTVTWRPRVVRKTPLVFRNSRHDAKPQLSLRLANAALCAVP